MAFDQALEIIEVSPVLGITFSGQGPEVFFAVSQFEIVRENWPQNAFDLDVSPQADGQRNQRTTTWNTKGTTGKHTLTVSVTGSNIMDPAENRGRASEQVTIK